MHDEIAAALAGYPHADTLWALSQYPDSQQLAAIRDTPGCVVILDFSDPLRAKAVAAELDRAYPMAVVIALQPLSGAQDLRELMQLGIREVVNAPLAGPELARAVTRAASKIQCGGEAAKPGGHIFTFLPAKPGAGATTLATHTAAAAARLAGQRLLLIDFDLRMGMSSFLLKLHSDHSVLDALISAEKLDAVMWDRFVGRHDMLDILGSAPASFGREIPEHRAPAVLDFAAQLYATLFIDVPGDLRDYELEILDRSKEIFLICTPDLGTLHMAKKKADALRTLDLATKVSVIVNRAGGRTAVPRADIEDVLQLPVRFHVESGEKEISEATHNGAAIEGRSAIAAQIENVARHIVPGSAPRQNDIPKRRFIEFFSLTPMRDKVGWKQ